MSEEEMLKYLNKLLDSTPNRNGNFVIQITSKDVYNLIDFITKKQENSVSKDIIREKINERQFELQQEFKDFKDDVRLNTLQEIYYLNEEE